MKASKFSDAQKVFFIRLGDDGAPVEEMPEGGYQPGYLLCVEEKVRWHDASEKKRMLELEEENSRLKRIVADQSFDRVMLQDVVKRKL